MFKRSFKVAAIWDDEAKVFFSESDIDGFHIESDSIEDFENLIMELAPDLIIANHFPADSIADLPLRELVPAILWQRPDDKVLACT